VEWDAYAASVLVARQNDGCLPPFPVWDDVQTFDGHPWRGRVDVVSGGFPCTDISCAGKGAGIDGEASGMWRHMARIIGEVRPQFVFVENSPMLVGRGLARVLADLAALGFDAQWGVVGAHHAGAPHKRDRIWIVASDSNRIDGDDRRHGASALCGEQGREPTELPGSEGNVADATGLQDIGRKRSNVAEAERVRKGFDPSAGVGGKDVANADCAGCEQLRRECADGEKLASAECGSSVCNAASAGFQNGAGEPMGEPGADAQLERSDWWATEPELGRVAHGVANRVDRLRCIGNGQVPAVVRLAWGLLTEE
jgi:DNA (cytosine-5)-methyltransferase 1